MKEHIFLFLVERTKGEKNNTARGQLQQCFFSKNNLDSSFDFLLLHSGDKAKKENKVQ